MLAIFLGSAPAADAVVPRGKGRIYVQPKTATVSKGSQFTVDVYLDTKGLPVNTVEAKLTFTQSRLTCVSQEAAPGWDLSFYPAPCANGQADIVVGKFGTTASGILKVGTLTFTATSATAGRASVKFSSQSAAINPNTGTDIIGSTAGGVYTIVVT